VRKALREIKVKCYLESCEKVDEMKVGELGSHSSMFHLNCPNGCDPERLFTEKELRFHMGNDCG